MLTKDIVKKYRMNKDQLTAMVDQICGNLDEETFNKMLWDNTPDYVNIRSLKSGDLVTGIVQSICGNTVLVEFGHKAEGILAYREGDHVNSDLDIGDVIQVLIKDTRNGQVSLTRRGVDKLVREDTTARSLSPGDRVFGEITHQTRAGWIVTINGCLGGFLPQAVSGFSMGTTLEKVQGKELEAEVVSVDAGARQVVLTRKSIAEEERRSSKENFMSGLEPGNVIEGVVKNITDFGAFIQVASGVIGLCHKADLGAEPLSLNQSVKVKVLRVDLEKNRISLGIRQASEPAWEEIIVKYAVDDRVTGVVTSFAPYGAFVEIEPGLQGLIHISDISWSEQVRRPSDFLTKGETVEAAILAIETERKRISLGLKQLHPDPWDLVDDHYLVGSVVTGKVTAVKDFGTFVELEKGVDGLIKDDMRRVSEGDVVDVIITRINGRAHKIDLNYC
jgi:small subunit ribosomal protein S1